jgi:hypothetical protein
VKPVTKQATVKANKVVTIDVAIEDPNATLTVILLLAAAAFAFR